MSLHQIVFTQKDHCSQNAVLGSQFHCPYIKNVLIASVLISRGYCTASGIVGCMHDMHPDTSDPDVRP